MNMSRIGTESVLRFGKNSSPISFGMDGPTRYNSFVIDSAVTVISVYKLIKRYRNRSTSPKGGGLQIKFNQNKLFTPFVQER